MKQNHVVIVAGVVIAVTLFALTVVARPAATVQSDQTAVSNSVVHTASVSPFDLQCTAKFPGGFAQCGSQASSCKSCHEVNGEMPVNATGEWHVSHAFGDFCEFCHAGNVQATDKAAAHEGLVQPLDDVKLNCSSCHAQDYQAKAEVYATALGVTIGGSGGAAQPPAGAATTAETTPQPAAEPAAEPAAQPVAEPAQQTAPQPVAAPALPKLASDEVVDYVAQYKAEQPQPLNTGSAVTGLLLAAVVALGAIFVIWNERRQHARQQRAAASLQAIMSNDERAQEMKQLLPVLEKLDTQALRGLRTFLSKQN